jgi:hypothetical protein
LKAIKGHRYILGPARGTDTLAFKFLRNSGVTANRIQVYLNAREDTRIMEEFYDILLRYRTEKECRTFFGPRYRKRISGTEKNELRRKAEKCTCSSHSWSSRFSSLLASLAHFYGPVVIINSSKYRCDVMVLAQGDLVLVRYHGGGTCQ